MGRPKALLKVDGRTFLENILEAIARTTVSDTVVVLGRHREEIQAVLHLSNSLFNASYEQGMITSIQTGIRALPAESEGALLFLVDHPFVKADTIQTLINGFAPERIVLPKFEGRRGHPVLFARDVLEEILQVPWIAGANVVVWKDPGRVVEIAVDDPGVTLDIDTPEDYSRLF
jgi:molybdenum cofactor cytidylyltransferase